MRKPKSSADNLNGRYQPQNKLCLRDMAELERRQKRFTRDTEVQKRKEKKQDE